MKRQLLYNSLFFVILATAMGALNARIEDAFAVVLMVKNESSVICQTLDPYVKEGMQSFLIFDTGSTDDTVEVVERYFQEHNIQDWYIFQEPFVDFEVSRNRALDLAEEHFPEATFFLMPDAEWYLHNVRKLIEFCFAHMHEDTECYLIRIANGTIDFRTSRLIRSRVNARFVGDVHEVIVANTYEKAPADIYFELGASRVGIEKSRQRWHRDKEKLLARYARNPEDPRTTFYLAQTFECLGEFEEAYKYYLVRCQQQGWIEETFEAFYRLGRLTEHLSKTNNDYTWQMAQEYYFAAHGLMPHRAEPLVKLAEHYWPDGEGPVNAALCYLYAKRAYELPYPEHDVLFINPEAYYFKRYELLSKAAWHVRDFALGEVATRKALAYTEMPYLFRNLACYIDAVHTSAAAA